MSGIDSRELFTLDEEGRRVEAKPEEILQAKISHVNGSCTCSVLYMAPGGFNYGMRVVTYSYVCFSCGKTRTFWNYEYE